jgi:hypothetical protein
MVGFIIGFIVIMFLGVCWLITPHIESFFWAVAFFYVTGGLISLGDKKMKVFIIFIKLGKIFAWLTILIFFLHHFVIAIFNSFPWHIIVTAIVYIVCTEIGGELYRGKDLVALCDNPDYHSDKPN